MSKSFKVGDRVRYCGSPVLGPSTNAIGTVALVAGVRGKSVHPDPSKLMTFVQWDCDQAQGVFTHQLELLPPIYGMEYRFSNRHKWRAVALSIKAPFTRADIEAYRHSIADRAFVSWTCVQLRLTVNGAPVQS